MKIKRFVAQDMRQALRLVRESMGQDAVILSSQRLPEGIELVAAADFDAELVSEIARKVEPVVAPPAAPRASEQPQPPAAAPQPAAAVVAAAIAEQQNPEGQSLSELQQELQSMRGLLEGHLARIAWGEFNRQHPQQAELVRKFKRMGIDVGVARQIAAGIPVLDNPRLAWRTALHGLARRMRFADDRIAKQGGIYALVGPTGVGKTTTLAKLAARHIIHHGRKQIALVSMDDYRIGAQSQLATYGQLLGVPTYHAGDVNELRRLLPGLGTKRLILIDTPGMSPRDGRLLSDLAGLAAIPRLDICLVLAANAERDVLRRALQSFSQAPLYGVILSKLDEAESLGGALSCLIGARLPLAYLGTGQRVAEDLEPAQAHGLIERAVSLVEHQAVSSTRSPQPRTKKMRMQQNAYAE
ncbi:MAG: flagellar biosynthesis protein FlhF [Gammaproteobacteria bacterium]|jgi:flagellar biosynthesis protein FlhF